VKKLNVVSLANFGHTQRNINKLQWFLSFLEKTVETSLNR